VSIWADDGHTGAVDRSELAIWPNMAIPPAFDQTAAPLLHRLPSLFQPLAACLPRAGLLQSGSNDAVVAELVDALA
jgi:hypothetical protein